MSCLHYSAYSAVRPSGTVEAVASLGLVSHGAAIKSVNPIFGEKTDDLLLLITVTFVAFIRVSPPGGCHPTLFHLADLVCPLFFVNSPTIFFLRVSSLPTGGCHPGRSPLVTPLSGRPSFCRLR